MQTATSFYVSTLYFTMYIQVLVLVIFGIFKNLNHVKMSVHIFISYWIYYMIFTLITLERNYSTILNRHFGNGHPSLVPTLKAKFSTFYYYDYDYYFY